MGERSGRRAVALVSGGLDSVVSLAIADRRLDVRLVLFFDYGQRSLERERSSVLAAANYFGLPFREVDIRWLRDLSPEGMRDREAGDGWDDALVELDSVWIPNRNGVFLNVAAAFAERYECDTVVAGFNREEAAEFADNTREFVDAVNAGLRYSTRRAVEVVSFTQDMSKREIVRAGIEAGAPLAAIWSCYKDGEKMCGGCASCRRLKAAIDSLPPSSRPMIEFES